MKGLFAAGRETLLYEKRGKNGQTFRNIYPYSVLRKKM